jgi:LIM domain kinase 1
LELCIDCCKTDPKERPTTREILERLRIIEAEVLARPSEGIDLHFGSVRFLTGVGDAGEKRSGAAPRIPSFGMGIGSKSGTSTSTDDSDDEDFADVVRGLSSLSFSAGLSEGSISTYLSTFCLFVEVL